MGSPPLHVVMAKLAADSREEIAARVLALDAVRDALSAAARQGLNLAHIPVGPANLGGTAAYNKLAHHLKGFTFQWVENAGKDGTRFWELRVFWQTFENI